MAVAERTWCCSRCKRSVDGPEDVGADEGLTVLCPECRTKEALALAALRCAVCGNKIGAAAETFEDAEGNPLCRECVSLGCAPEKASAGTGPAATPPLPTDAKQVSATPQRFVAQHTPRPAPAQGRKIAWVLAAGAAFTVVGILVQLLIARNESPDRSVLRARIAGPVGVFQPARTSEVDPSPPGRLPTGSQRDAQGRLILVTGADPAAVLRALCDEYPAGALVPVSVGEGSPPLPGVRLGTVRLTVSAGALATVTVRHDPRARRWVIGNGHGPIQLMGAPAAITH